MESSYTHINGTIKQGVINIPEIIGKMGEESRMSGSLVTCKKKSLGLLNVGR
jgi:hypothetical protein